MTYATIFNILPQEMEVDGCKVTVMEALKSRVLEQEWMHLVVQVTCRGVSTKPFTIDARSPREFRAKLKTEIAKLKMLIHLHGPSVAQWLVGG